LFAFHAVGGLVHLLLIVAVISVVADSLKDQGTTARV